MKVKPIGNKKIYDPINGDFLPPDGRNVENSQYWLRRIADRDVIEIKSKEDTKKGTK